MSSPKRCALYARVSTDDRGQDPEAQLAPLREFARHRGFLVADTFVDDGSGRRRERPRFQALFSAARRRQIDVVLVWRYDRFARSLQELVNALADFRTLEQFPMRWKHAQVETDPTLIGQNCSMSMD